MSKKFLLVLFMIIPIAVYANLEPGTECVQGPNLGHTFQGTVIYGNGTPVQSDNLINATLGNYHFTTTTDSNGQYGYSSPFKVWNCRGDASTLITFYVQGVATNTTSFSVGGGPTTFNITSMGVVCGDGRCNGTETTGNTNVYPECNRDCGAPTTTTTTTGGGGGGGGAAGGGGGATVPSEVNLAAKADFATTGTTLKQTQGDKAKFKVLGVQYTVEVTKLTSDSVTITVAGQSTVLKIGDSVEFDVNGDGSNDLSVNLKGIEGGRAEIVYKLLAKAEEKPTEEVPPEVKKEKGEVTPPVTKGEISKAWIGWVIVAVIVVIGLIVYFAAKKKKPEIPV